MNRFDLVVFIKFSSCIHELRVTGPNADWFHTVLARQYGKENAEMIWDDYLSKANHNALIILDGFDEIHDPKKANLVIDWLGTMSQGKTVILMSTKTHCTANIITLENEPTWTLIRCLGIQPDQCGLLIRRMMCKCVEGSCTCSIEDDARHFDALYKKNGDEFAFNPFFILLSFAANVNTAPGDSVRLLKLHK